MTFMDKMKKAFDCKRIWNAIKQKCKRTWENIKRKFKKLKQRKVKDCIFPVVVWTLLLIWTVIFCTLLGWGIISSFKNYVDFTINPGGLPKEIYWENYEIALRNLSAQVADKENGGMRTAYLPEMFWNTFLYAMVQPFIAVFVMECCCYAIAKYRNQFLWVGGIFSLSVFVNFFEVAPSLATTLKIQQALGLYDSMVGQWIWNCGAIGGGMFVHYACMKSISGTYAEAAFIDGAGHFRAFFSIVRPIASGIFWAMWFGKFINFWNNYSSPLYFLPSYPTISYSAWQIQFSSISEFASVPAKLAGLTIVILPIIIIYIVFNKQIMNRQLAFGGIKG